MGIEANHDPTDIKLWRKGQKPLLVGLFISFEFEMQELFTAIKSVFEQMCRQDSDRIQT